MKLHYVNYAEKYASGQMSVSVEPEGRGALGAREVKEAAAAEGLSVQVHQHPIFHRHYMTLMGSAPAVTRFLQNHAQGHAVTTMLNDATFDRLTVNALLGAAALSLGKATTGGKPETPGTALSYDHDGIQQLMFSGIKRVFVDASVVDGADAKNAEALLPGFHQKRATAIDALIANTIAGASLVAAFPNARAGGKVVAPAPQAWVTRDELAEINGRLGKAIGTRYGDCVLKSISVSADAYGARSHFQRIENVTYVFA